MNIARMIIAYEGAIIRYQCNAGAYRMVVPRLIDQFEERDMDGLPSIK